jgi:hypothetical protein
MTPNDLIRSALKWLLYVLLHVFVVRHLVLFDYAFCYIYLGAVLFLPFELNLTAALLISFVTGTIMDSFDNTLGLHIIATVLVAYIRPILIRYQLAQKISENRLELSLRGIGLPAFLSYVLVLVSIHHFVLLMVEAGGFGMFGFTLLKILCSIVFTTIALTLGQAFSR